MLIYNHVPKLHNTSAALGFFDGLHPGHRAVITAAHKPGCSNLLFTFSPKGSHKPQDSLLLEPERDRLLEEMGIDAVVSPDFCDIAALSPEEFVRGILSDMLGVAKVACGESYRFGANAAGDSAELLALCEKYGIECELVKPVLSGGSVISSSAVRSALGEGRVEEANAMLGRRYGYCLTVRDGRHLGRTLGAPTINQHFPEGFFLPRFGVYASVAKVDQRLHPAVTNIGIKPTVGSSAPLSETYIQGFSGDLYNRNVDVRLISFLRPEQKFPDIDSLREAIFADAHRSLELCSGPDIFE